MKEREATQRLKKWMERKGWIVYRAPDSYHTLIECPVCVKNGKPGMLYCKECAAWVPKEVRGSFVPYKPADIVVVQGPDGRGFWVEVKMSKALTEKGMVYRPKYVKPHQAKAMKETDGYLAICFEQKRKEEKDLYVGFYMVRWNTVFDKESISREELRAEGAKDVIVVKDTEEVIPYKKTEKEDSVFPFLDGK